MTSLGDLPGGATYSAAYGISADGTTIVGRSGTDAGNESFRWTSGGGMHSLGGLEPGTDYSAATAASYDGSVVVGIHETASGYYVAYIWTAATGMLDLNEYLGTTLGLDLDGLTLVHATGISDNGTEITGWVTGATVGSSTSYKAVIELPLVIPVATPVGGVAMLGVLVSLLIATAMRRANSAGIAS